MKINNIKKIFYDVFSEPLFQKEFVICRDYGCFMRLVDGEVLQYLMLINDRADKKGYNAFYIQMGMFSLYVKPIEKYRFESYGNRAVDIAILKELPYQYRYEYDPADLSAVKFQMNEALKEAKVLFFDVIDSVHNLRDYVSFCKSYRIDVLYGTSKYAFDSLSLIMVDDHDDFEEILHNKTERIKKECLREGRMDIYEERCERLKKCILGMGAGERDKVYADKELYAAALEEAKRRKETNLQILRGLKVID